MSTLLSPFPEKPAMGQDLLMLQGDARLIVIAGRLVCLQLWQRKTANAVYHSDTTASTLTHIFYHLAHDVTQIGRLRSELAPYFEQNLDAIDPFEIQHLNHLNGIINETLRLHPPVPTAIPRLTPPEGIQIGEVHVPGSTTVWCPPYVMGRS